MTNKINYQNNSSSNNNNSSSNKINYQNIIGEQFKESTNIFISKDNSNNSVYNSIFYEFEKIINNIKDAESFYQCFLPSLKVYLVTTNDTINNISKFISKFLINLIISYLNNNDNNNNSNNNNNIHSSTSIPSSNNSNSISINKKNYKIAHMKFEIYQLIIEFLIKVLESKDSVVRLRSLQVINHFINDSLFDTSFIDGDSGNSINESILLKYVLERSQDKNSNIRLLVTNILFKLLNIYIINNSNSRNNNNNNQLNNNTQINNNINNQRNKFIIQKIINNLLETLENDHIWNIRNNILVNLPQFKNELGESALLDLIIVRSRDVKDKIRLESLKILSNTYQFDQLTKSQVIQLLNTMFKDKNEKNLDFSCNLVKRWFSLVEPNKVGILNDIGEYEMMDLGQDNISGILNNSNDDNDEIWLYRFLEFIGVKENEEVLKNVLIVLLKQGIIKEFSLVENNEVTLEQSFYCRVTCQYLKSINNQESEERLELLLPTLTELRDIIFNHLESDHYTLEQLLHLIEYSDLTGDEAGRANVHLFLIEFLKALGDEEELINQTLSSLSVLQRTEREFITLVVEIISDFIEPLEDDPELEDYKKRIFILSKNYPKFEKKSPSEAEKIKTAIATLQDRINSKETETLKKCSIITHYLLLNAKKCSNSPEIDGLLSTVILPSISHQNGELRNIGIKNLGIFCLHRKKEALKQLSILEKAFGCENLQISITCLKAIFDILVVFGSPNQIPKETESLYKMIRNQFENINNGRFSNSLEIKEIFIQGFVKLLYSGIVYDPIILKSLLLELFSPKTSSLLELRQCLTLFFSEYVSDVIFNKKLLFDCSFDVFKTIVGAPQKSPYSQINLAEVSRFVASLLNKPSRTIDLEIKDLDLDEFKEEDCQANLILQICQEFSNFYDGTKELTKALQFITIHPNSTVSILENIYDHLKSILDYYSDPFLLKLEKDVKKLVSKEFLESRSQLSQISQSINNLINSNTITIKNNIINNNNNNNSNIKSTTSEKSQIFNTPMKRLLQKSNGNNTTTSTAAVSKPTKTSPVLQSYFSNQKGIFGVEDTLAGKRKKKLKTSRISSIVYNSDDSDDDQNSSLDVGTIYNFPFLHKSRNNINNNTSDSDSLSSDSSDELISNQEVSNLTRNMKKLNNNSNNSLSINLNNNNITISSNSNNSNIYNNNNNNNNIIINNNNINKSILKKKVNQNKHQKKVRFLNATPANEKNK